MKYGFNKQIIMAMFITLLIACLSIWIIGGFKLVFLNANCPSNSFEDCENPFYNVCNPNGKIYNPSLKVCKMLNYSMVENQKIKPGQTIGEKTPLLVEIFPFIVMAIIILFLIFNHYNKGEKKYITINEAKE